MDALDRYRRDMRRVDLGIAWLMLNAALLLSAIGLGVLFYAIDVSMFVPKAIGGVFFVSFVSSFMWAAWQSFSDAMDGGS